MVDDESGLDKHVKAFYDAILYAQNHAQRVVVGLQGVQGSGKSHVCRMLCRRDSRVRSLSLDDFYLPHAALCKLSECQSQPLDRDAYRVRGNPGTHDAEQMVSAVRAWKQTGCAAVPLYDKRAHDGEGDRCDGMRTIQGGSVLLVEGWMLGFVPLRTGSRIDHALDAYQPLHELCDGFVVLRAPSLDVVYQWREEAEAAARAIGAPAMSEEEVRRFVDVYMPTYRAYLPVLYRAPPVSKTLHLCLDRARCVTRRPPSEKSILG